MSVEYDMCLRQRIRELINFKKGVINSQYIEKLICSDFSLARDNTTLSHEYFHY